MTVHAGKKIHPRLLDCSACGFVHLDPLPDADTVRAYYEDDKFYETHSPPDWFVKEKWEHEQGYWQAYYDYLIGFLRPYTPTIDIGAGSGWFVKRCPYAIGVEPSVIARWWSPVPDDMLPDLAGINGKGNIVLMLTLEHVLDPESFLRDEVLPHLDGRLIVTVPNEFNPLQVALRTDHFISKVHINYFTRDSLKGLLEKVGLRVVAEGANFPTEAFCFIGRNHIGDDEMGRKNHLLRLRLEKRFPSIYKLYSLLFRTFGIGREMILVAERR